MEYLLRPGIVLKTGTAATLKIKSLFSSGGHNEKVNIRQVSYECNKSPPHSIALSTAGSGSSGNSAYEEFRVASLSEREVRERLRSHHSLLHRELMLI